MATLGIRPALPALSEPAPLSEELRISILVQGLEGGIASLVCGLVPHLQARGLKVQTLFMGAGSARIPEVQTRVFPCGSSPWSKAWQMLTVGPKLNAAMEAFAPHLTLCAGLLPAIVYGLFVRSKVPAVLWEHGPQNSYGVTKYRALEACRRRFSYCLSPSHSSREVFLRQFPVFPRERCFVLENGVPPEEFAANNRPLRLEDGLRIIMPARLDGIQKDQESLIRGCGLLAQAGYPVKLTLLGDGPDKTRLRSLAVEVSPRGVVAFRDYTNRVAEALAEHNVVCLSSRWEGFGLALIEGMMSGLLAVGANVTGITDVIQEGQTGRLFAPRSADAIAATLLSVLWDPRRHEDIARQGREQACRRWTSEVMARHAVELLLQFAG